MVEEVEFMEDFPIAKRGTTRKPSRSLAGRCYLRERERGLNGFVKRDGVWFQRLEWKDIDICTRA